MEILSPLTLSKYRAKNCNTIEQVEAALTYLYSIGDTLTTHARHNWQSSIYALEIRKKKLTKTNINAVCLPTCTTREQYYHEILIRSVEFLKPAPDGKKLEVLYGLLQKSLILHELTWTNDMYSDLVDFKFAFTPGERKVQFIHKILTCGLRQPEQIINLINYFIKLVNILHLNENISVDLPNKKSLHDCVYALSGFKY